MVRDWARSALFFGLGLASLTREKAQEWAEDLVERGEVSGQETQAVVDRLMKQAQEQRERLSDMVESEVGKWVERLELVKRPELEERTHELERRIARLEARVADTEGDAAGVEDPPDPVV